MSAFAGTSTVSSASHSGIAGASAGKATIAALQQCLMEKLALVTQKILHNY
ncbi:MAG: hypothetical protein QM541_01385 [Flavobacterium sp.]|nr:hypothetical protein [Flavobacterium sp.]